MEKLTDITIIVGGKRFELHKAILCLFSDYFICLLTNGMKESTQKEIDISDTFTLDQFELFHRFMYSNARTYDVIGAICSEAVFKEYLQSARLLLSDKYSEALEQELIHKYATWDMNLMQMYIISCNYGLERAEDYAFSRVNEGHYIIKVDIDLIDEFWLIKNEGKIFRFLHTLSKGKSHDTFKSIHKDVCDRIPNQKLAIGYLKYIIAHGLAISLKYLKHICKMIKPEKNNEIGELLNNIILRSLHTD